MSLNSLMALILRCFTEFCSFRGQLRQSDWR